MSETHQLTVRMPANLYRRIANLAREQGTSVNQLAQRGLEAVAREALARRMRQAYDALGASSDADVEDYLPAQREVLEHEQR